MADFLTEGPEDLKKKVSFDKFMDEILVTESKRKAVEEDDEDEHRVRKLMKETTDRPGNRTRYNNRGK